ncbi:ATP-binding protein [Desulfosarcina variabilis]|uniref:ATP-binding protein n=1 Tax=Desulfosarcina variabilis TaxID=2300 RepID=UPI003AFA0254
MATSDDSSKICLLQSSRFSTSAPPVDLRSPGADSQIPFESLLDSMPEFIIYYDQNLNVLWANHAAAADHGLKPDDMIGRPFFEVSCMLKEPCEGCPVIMGMNSDSAEAIENNPYVGRLFYTRSYPVFRQGKLIPSRLFVAQDISNLKNRYSVTEILNQINELFHTRDELPRICKKLIRSIVSSFGYVYGAIALSDDNPEQIIAMGLVDFSGNFSNIGKRLPASRCFTGKVMADGEMLNITHLSQIDEFDGYLLKQNGAETVLAVPLKIEDRTIGAIVLADLIPRMETRLIMERLCTVANRLAAEVQRKQAEDRLREERNFTTAVLDNAGPLIMVMDRLGRIVRFNKTCERLTGYSYKDVIGRYVWEIGIAETNGDGDTMKNLFPFTRDKTLPPAFESTIITKSAEKRLISWSNSIMGGAPHPHVHIVSIGMDITEKIAAQEEADIRRRQLVEADKMVSLGILASEVAHEINNPNNFIAMNAPILRKAWEDIAVILNKYNDACGDFLVANVPYSEMSREIPALFDGIENGSERIRKIVKNMKNYARMDEPASVEPVNMNTVIHTALTLLSTQIKSSAGGISQHLCEPLPPVMGNFQRLEQVIVNLIQNACQALSGKGSPITIKTSVDPERNLVCVRICDQGAGIRPEHVSRIFDPFFTTKADSGGTGLGLSVCAAIVKEHKGDLAFDSSVGKGTTVTLCLPACQ